MINWATVASLATAAGTLILAIATFAAVRSANRAARATERALLASIRPVLVPSRMTDAPEKVGFMDDHWVQVPGGGAIAEATDDSVYLAIALRNVGTGLAVLDRWELWVERLRRDEPGPIESFRRLTRDLYIAAGDGGFWQGTIRDPTDPLFASVGAAIRERQAMTVDLLYGDHDGGQRAITRFALLPAGDSKWIAAVSRHWSLDRDQPREAPSGR